MARYDHAVTIAFSVISNDPQGLDFTPIDLRAALFSRIAALGLSDEWLEAVGAPFDSHPADEATA
ncbi:hypothetical protein [Sphingomonas sp. VNH70]|uniref:hypothetical protein n=1 Tax=Sphingomonas silueang TaxID=3156617 RepID=UPI0032B3518A